MSRCVPSCDLEDVNPNHDVFRLEYEVAELKWENGQLAMHELGSRRVPSKYTWEKPRAAETLEAIVNQATLQSYCKNQVPVHNGGGDELVPWLNHHHHLPTAAVGSINAPSSATMTSDAMVPRSNNKRTRQSTMSARDDGCSTRVGSCSGDPSAFVDRRVAGGGGGGGGCTTAETHDWSSCKDQSESGTFVTIDTYDGDLDGRRRLTSTSTGGSPENTSSGKDFSNSTSPDNSVSHPRIQREVSMIKEKKRVKVNSISNKRRRTPAIHNQSERKRRDKINERMKTLQKLVPNSSKTDKASMLEEIIEYVKQLQAYVHMINRMNMSSMMMPLAIQQQQQQQQMQMSMLNSMGMGMGMGLGMGMGGMDINTIPTGFHPSTFMHMPSWNGLTANRAANNVVLPADPMYTFLGCQSQSQPMNMDAYSRMAALYQHMQNQPCAPNSKN